MLERMDLDNVTEGQRIEAELEAEDREIEADDAPDDYDAVVEGRARRAGWPWGKAEPDAGERSDGKARRHTQRKKRSPVSASGGLEA